MNPFIFLFQEALSNQQTFFGSSNDFLEADDFSNNNSSSTTFLGSRRVVSSQGNSANELEGSFVTPDPEVSLSNIQVGCNSNALATGGGATLHQPLQILGSTPLSQIGCMPVNLEQYSAQLSPSCGDSEDESCGDSELDTADDIGSNYSPHSRSKRQKRGILPKHATSVMRAWLFQHLVVSESGLNFK